MSTPLSICDISARYGQTSAPEAVQMESSGWDFNQLCRDYLRKAWAKRREDLEDAEEDALMAMIDAMNAPKDRWVDPDEVALRALERVGRIVSEEHEGKVDPTQFLSTQVLLSVLGDRVAFEQLEGILEDQEKVRGEKPLKITEDCDPSDPDDNKKEV